MDEETLKEKWKEERKIQEIEQTIAEPEQRGRKGAIYIKIIDDWLTIEEIGKIIKGEIPLVYYHGTSSQNFDDIIKCGGIKPEKRREYTEKLNEHLKRRKEIFGLLKESLKEMGGFFGFFKIPRRERKIRKLLVEERRKILDLFSEMKQEYNRDVERLKKGILVNRMIENADESLRDKIESEYGKPLSDSAILKIRDPWFIFFGAENPFVANENFSNVVEFTYELDREKGLISRGVVFEIKPSFYGHIFRSEIALGDLITPHKVDFRYILRIYADESNIDMVKSKLREAGLNIDVQPFNNQPEIHKRMFEELERIYEEKHQEELEKAKKEISEKHEEELGKASEEIRETHERELEEAKEEIEKMIG